MDNNSYKEQYEKLLQDYKDLDEHNDVLYRCYSLAKRLRDQEVTPELAEAFKQSINDVEKFENELHSSNKRELRPPEEDEEG